MEFDVNVYMTEMDQNSLQSPQMQQTINKISTVIGNCMKKGMSINCRWVTSNGLFNAASFVPFIINGTNIFIIFDPSAIPDPIPVASGTGGDFCLVTSASMIADLPEGSFKDFLEDLDRQGIPIGQDCRVDEGECVPGVLGPCTDNSND